MCDEFTRESVGGLLGRSITADDVVAELDRLRLQCGGPEYIRCDNGPEFISQAIRDWCRFSATGASFLDPASPWQNAYVESFNGKARDELFAREIFDSVLEARALYEDCATPTISTAPTVRCGCSRRQSSPRLPTTRNSHPTWTDKRGPLTGTHRGSCKWSRLSVGA